VIRWDRGWRYRVTFRSNEKAKIEVDRGPRLSTPLGADWDVESVTRPSHRTAEARRQYVNPVAHGSLKRRDSKGNEEGNYREMWLVQDYRDFSTMNAGPDGIVNRVQTYNRQF
jgi:hypothetical protein